MITAVRMEWRKIVTTRLWWLLLLGMVAYLGIVAAFIAISVELAGERTAFAGPLGDLSDPATVRLVYGLGASSGFVFPLVVGTLSVTAEYRQGTIATTLLAEPRRGVVVAAKLVAQMALGAVYGVAATAACVLGGGAVLLATGHGLGLDDAEVRRTLVGASFALVLWAAVGVGFGALLHHQIAAIVVILGVTQFVEPIARFVLATWDATRGVARYLPGAASEALAGSSFYSTTGTVDLLSRWGGALVLAGYAVALTVVALATAMRRDVV